MRAGLNHHARRRKFSKFLSQRVSRGANTIFFGYCATRVQGAVTTPAIAEVDPDGVTSARLVGCCSLSCL
jgi:hypothetical protein